MKNFYFLMQISENEIVFTLMYDKKQATSF